MRRQDFQCVRSTKPVNDSPHSTGLFSAFRVRLAIAASTVWLGFAAVAAAQSTVPVDTSRLYTIESVARSGQVLDLLGAKTEISTNVTLYGSVGGANQLWKLVPAGGDFYYIETPLKAGMNLDVENSGQADGTNIRLWNRNGATAQQFKFVDAGQGQVKIVSAMGDSFTLGVANDGVNIVSRVNNRSNQTLFRLKPVGDSPQPSPTPRTGYTRVRVVLTCDKMSSNEPGAESEFYGTCALQIRGSDGSIVSPLGRTMISGVDPLLGQVFWSRNDDDGQLVRLATGETSTIITAVYKDSPKLDSSRVKFTVFDFAEDDTLSDTKFDSKQIESTQRLADVRGEKKGAKLCDLSDGSGGTQDKVTFRVLVDSYSRDHQNYAVDNIPALFKSMKVYNDLDLENIGAEVSQRFGKNMPKISGLIYKDHVQGLGFTSSGRMVVSHSLTGAAGLLAVSKGYDPVHPKSNFTYQSIASNEPHPSTLQSCGDLVMLTDPKGCDFYESIPGRDGLQPIGKHIRIDENTRDLRGGTLGGELKFALAGFVYHKKLQRYLVVVPTAGTGNNQWKTSLLRSTTSNLRDPNCRFERIAEYIGPASSTGTHLLYQEDGSVFVLACWSDTDEIAPFHKEAKIRSDTAMLAKIPTSIVGIQGSFSSIPQAQKVWTGVLKYDALTVTTTVPCFRFGTAVRIENDDCFIVSCDRTFESNRSEDFTMRYIKTNR